MSCDDRGTMNIPFTHSGHLPGYGGFCPTVTQRCGLTYGNATRLYHIQSRDETLNTSRKSFRDSGWLGETAVIFTRPAPGMKNHWSQPFSYSLQSGQRREEIFLFNQLLDPINFTVTVLRLVSFASCTANPTVSYRSSLNLKHWRFKKQAQKHRNYYKDHSGGVERVPGISLKMHYSQTFTRSMPTVQSTTTSTVMQSQKVKPHVHSPQGQISARERAIRDIYFERR
ncbi:hypothetical protein EMCRGX_G025809 [Ephydatia muelleri]